MVATGMLEIVILLIFGGGGVGIPLGVPPAPENPIMAQIAPEECLFYATWSAPDTIDPSRNATEKWMAQPEIQESWSKFKTALDSYFENYEGRTEHDTVFSQAMFKLARQGVMGSAAFYLESLEVDENGQPTFTGGALIDYGEGVTELVDQLNSVIEHFADELDAEVINFQIKDGPSGVGLELSDNGQRISWTTYQDRYLVLGFGDDSIEGLIANTETPTPAWLQQVRESLAIEKFSSVTYANGQQLFEILHEISPDPMLSDVLQKLGLDGIKSVAWTSGMDEKGFVTRTNLQLDGEPRGLFDIVDTKPLDPENLARIPDGKTLTTATRISSQKLYDLVLELSKMEPGADLQMQIDELNDAADIDFHGQIIEQLADYAYIYGSISPMNPTAGWVLSVGVKNEMVVDEAFNNIVEYVRDINEGVAEIEESEVNGYIIYTFANDDPFMIAGPNWCFAEGEILFSLDKSSLRRHIRREVNADDRWIASDQVTELFQPNESGNQPIMVSSVDVGKIIELVMSFRDFVIPGGDDELIPGMEFRASDIPSTQALVNGLGPNFSAAYRTEDGYEMLQRQTLPGGSPGGIVGTVFLGVGPMAFTARRQAVAVDSMNRMRQLVIAMHNYHDAHRALPSQFSKDADGNPLLSWRVHILPYIEHGDLYEQFHLDEPWDSEHNKTLIDQMPDVFAHPRMDLENGKTAYLVPVGDGGVFGEPEDSIDDTDFPTGMFLGDIRDGTSRTLALVVVSEEHAVEWTKPSDFNWEDFETIKDAFYKTDGTNYSAAFCDGSVQKLKEDVSEEVLKKLLKGSDGEVIGPDDY